MHLATCTMHSAPLKVINCVYLLRMVHSASRQGAPGLELLGKITDTEEQGREQLRDNTAFGFLAALVGTLVCTLYSTLYSTLVY